MRKRCRRFSKAEEDVRSPKQETRAALMEFDPVFGCHGLATRNTEKRLAESSCNYSRRRLKDGAGLRSASTAEDVLAPRGHVTCTLNRAALFDGVRREK